MRQIIVSQSAVKCLFKDTKEMTKVKLHWVVPGRFVHLAQGKTSSIKVLPHQHVMLSVFCVIEIPDLLPTIK